MQTKWNASMRCKWEQKMADFLQLCCFWHIKICQQNIDSISGHFLLYSQLEHINWERHPFYWFDFCLTSMILILNRKNLVWRLNHNVTDIQSNSLSCLQISCNRQKMQSTFYSFIALWTGFLTLAMFVTDQAPSITDSYTSQLSKFHS